MTDQMIGQKVSNFTVESLIAQGLSCSVYKVNDGSKSYALKLYKQNFRMENRRKEISLLERLKENPYVVKLISYDTQNFEWAVTELWGDDLYNAFEEPIPEPTACYIVKQIVQAMISLQEAGIVHRDIKMENVLIEKQTHKIKLCDFGSSVYLEDGIVPRSQGTIGYMAPELQMLTNDYFIDAKELINSDVFSLGCLIFCLVFRVAPMADTKKNVCKLWRAISERKFVSYWKYMSHHTKIIPSDEFKNLLENLWPVKPDERWDLVEILNSRWLNQELLGPIGD